MPCNAHVSHKEKETPRAQTLHWHFILIALEYVSPQGDTTARPLRVIEMRRIRVILYIPSFRSLPPHRLKDNHIALKFAASSCEKQIFVLLFISSLRVCVFISSFCCLCCFLSWGKGKKEKERGFSKTLGLEHKANHCFFFSLACHVYFIPCWYIRGRKKHPPILFLLGSAL